MGRKCGLEPLIHMIRWSTRREPSTCPPVGEHLPIYRYDLRARVQEVAVMDEVSDLRDHLLSAELLPADD